MHRYSFAKTQSSAFLSAFSRVLEILQINTEKSVTPVSEWGILLILQCAWMGAKSTGGRVGLLGFLNGRQRCRYGSKLIGGCGSHCQAWWKPNPAMTNFTNIAAGGTCWTCLLSALQMVGNVPDLLTPSGGLGSWGTSTRATHTDSLACVNACMCMNVRLWLSLYINCHTATWVFLYPVTFFICTTHGFHKVSSEALSNSQETSSLNPLCELHSLSTSIHKPTLSRLCSSRFCKVFTVTSVTLVALQ